MSKENLQLRLLSIGAAFVAGWLAGRTDGQSAIGPERGIAVDPDALPAPAKAAAVAVTTVGYPMVYVPLAWWLSTRLDERGVTGAHAISQSAVAAWVSYHVVKTLVHRERPPAQQGDSNDDRSYPSGHATAAAAIAMSTAYLWLRQDGVRPRTVLRVAIASPLVIGASRIALGEHWPTDIVGGIATGVAVGAHLTANAREAAIVR